MADHDEHGARHNLLDVSILPMLYLVFSGRPNTHRDEAGSHHARWRGPQEREAWRGVDCLEGDGLQKGERNGAI